MNKKIIPFVFYGITVLGLFLYSFTQIDLSLTFSRITILRNIVTSFQQIGYFNRPLSAYIYISIILLLFGFYLYFLKQAFIKKLDKKSVWKLLIFSVFALTFSYNAFSYDLFNYIFDAKIFTYYNQNPYLHKALDFPTDPMLSFMRWTHRVYPYGPVWLFLTVPLSYLGFNLFLPTFFLIKLLISASFIGSLYFISKIMKKISPEKELLTLVFFGLNPLVLVESLVSSHLDVVMIFFVLWAFYQLVNKKYIFVFFLLFLSIGVKFSTLFILPIFLIALFLNKNRKNINWDLILNLSVAAATVTVFVASIYSGNFQPWYLLLPISFAAFFANRYYIFIPFVIISFFALLNYIPYLYLGNWDKPVPQIISGLNILGVGVATVCILVYAFFKKNKK